MDIMEFISNFTIISYICFLLGFVLIIIEMSQPGISVPGIVGTILLIVGIAVTAKSLEDVLLMIVIVIIVLAIALTIIINSATKGQISRNIVLNDAIDGSSGNYDDLYYLIDKEGKALSSLRPSGVADFNGVKLDVLSEGDFIEKGSKVKIVKIESLSIIVKKVEEIKEKL